MPKNLNEALLTVAATLPVEDPQVQKRVDRAEGILKGYGYQIETTMLAGRYLITKASTSLLENNEHGYVVDAQSCDCPDFPTARAGLCKHRIAVLILEEMKA